MFFLLPLTIFGIEIYIFKNNLDFSTIFIIEYSHFYFCSSIAGGAFFISVMSNIYLKSCLFNSCFSISNKKGIYGRNAGGGSFFISCNNFYGIFNCIVNCSAKTSFGAFYISLPGGSNDFVHLNQTSMKNSYSTSCTGLIDSGYLLLFNYNSTQNSSPGTTAAFHYGIVAAVTNRGYNSSFILCISNQGSSIYGGYCSLDFEMFTKNSIFYNNTVIQGLIQLWLIKHSMDNCNFIKNVGRNDYAHESGCILTYYNCIFDSFSGTGILINHILTSNFFTIYLEPNPFCTFEKLNSFLLKKKLLKFSFINVLFI